MADIKSESPAGFISEGVAGIHFGMPADIVGICMPGRLVQIPCTRVLREMLDGMERRSALSRPALLLGTSSGGEVSRLVEASMTAPEFLRADRGSKEYLKESKRWRADL